MPRTRRIARLSALLPFALACACAAAPRIEWNASTRAFACAGTYARVKKLSGGNVVLVYSSGGRACFRAGQPDGSWGPEIAVAEDAGYGDTNAELAELADGTLVFAWNGRPKAGSGSPYFIGTKRSRDGGRTWTDAARAYAAGTDASVGCWEPALSVLPGGGLQLYFANEAPYASDSDQEIGMLASADGGKSWSGYRTVSHRAGARDGMPVPVALRDGSGTLVAIEDNGIDGDFKPALLRSGPGGDWGPTPVAAKDPRRSLAVAGAERLAAPVYAGAPYLVQMPSGELVLSCQSTEGRLAAANSLDHAVMQVYVAGAGSGFAGKSTPFALPDDGQSLWNSLAVVDDSTVMAVGAVRGLGKDGIWTVRGRLIRDNPASIRPLAAPSPALRPRGAYRDPLGRLSLVKNVTILSAFSF